MRTQAFAPALHPGLSGLAARTHAAMIPLARKILKLPISDGINDGGAEPDFQGVLRFVSLICIPFRGEGRADRFSARYALLTDGILGQSFPTAHYQKPS
jgi:hypothetical protein